MPFNTPAFQKYQIRSVEPLPQVTPVHFILAEKSPILASFLHRGNLLPLWQWSHTCFLFSKILTVVDVLVSVLGSHSDSIEPGQAMCFSADWGTRLWHYSHIHFFPVHAWSAVCQLMLFICIYRSFSHTPHAGRQEWKPSREALNLGEHSHLHLSLAEMVVVFWERLFQGQE